MCARACMRVYMSVSACFSIPTCMRKKDLRNKREKQTYNVARQSKVDVCAYRKETKGVNGGGEKKGAVTEREMGGEKGKKERR